MKRILFYKILAVSVFFLTFNSCKKDKPDTETQSAVDNSICEDEFTKIMPTVNSMGMKEDSIKGMMLAACPTITVSTGGWPRILTINYGTGCNDSIDGKIRKGKVICKFYSKWSTIGSKVTVTLENYYVNNIRYTADSVTISRDAAYTFTNTIYNGKSIGSGWSLEWSATRTTTQLDGYNTALNPYDDVFQVTGNANGKNRNGLTYTINIASPIVKRSTCAWIESGKLDLTPSGYATRSVDFGTGSCDDKATITIGGNTFNFQMK
ncbi:MAG: hypothetical protein ACT4ON_08275 [Bacteroidota bacterium]